MKKNIQALQRAFGWQPEVRVAALNPTTQRPGFWVTLKNWSGPLDPIVFRCQLDVEIILDLDLSSFEENEELFYAIVRKRLLENGIGFEAYRARKSVHVHIFFSKPLSNEERTGWIEEKFSDVMHAFDAAYWTKEAQLTVVEGAIHFKTGLPKQLICNAEPLVNEFLIGTPKKVKKAREPLPKRDPFDITSAPIPICIMSCLAAHMATDADRRNLVMFMKAAGYGFHEAMEILKTYCCWSGFNEAFTRYHTHRIYFNPCFKLPPKFKNWGAKYCDRAHCERTGVNCLYGRDLAIITKPDQAKGGKG